MILIYSSYFIKMNNTSMFSEKSWNDMVDDMDEEYDTYKMVIPMIYTIIDEEIVSKNINLDKININKYSAKEECQNL